jgi:peptidoglycan hydrolase-like protein with peptidoglycan-binding domain
MKKPSPFALSVKHKKIVASVSMLLAGLLLFFICPSGASETAPFAAEDFEKQFDQMKSDSKHFPQIIAIVQMALGAWGFGTGPFDGVLDAKTKGSLSKYQMARGFKAAGELDAATTKMIFNDFEEWEKTPPNLPALHVGVRFWDFGFLSAQGTWVIEGEQQGFPFQTTEIRCDKQKQQYTEATAEYNLESSFLSITLNTYDIERWDEHEITTRPVDFRCESYTLRIGRAEESVTALRLRTKTEGVCGHLKTEMKLRLEDGFKVYWPLQKARGAKIRSFIQARGVFDFDDLH